MLGKIILFIMVLGFCDVYLVVWSANYLTVLGAIGLCVLTALIGGYLFKREGFRILFEFQREMMEGKMPFDKLGDGVLVLIGGVMLITPGYVSDSIGFLLMIPWVRKLVKPFLFNIVKNHMHIQVHSNVFHNQSNGGAKEKDADIIDIK